MLSQNERYTSHGSFAHNLKNHSRLSRQSSLVLARNTESQFTFAWFSNVKCRANMYSVAGRTSVSSRCYSFGIPGYLWDKKIYINFSIESSGYLRRGVTCTLILQYIGYHHLSRVTVVFHISLRNLNIYCTSTLNECIYIPGCCI